MSVSENIRFEELRPDSWPAVERLFGPNGACAGCWCMYWRRAPSHQAWKEMQGAGAKEAFKDLIQKGRAHGVLAFDGDDPVGWCSFGPRRDFPVLENSKNYKRNDTSNVWSITCFFIHRKWRRKGLSRGLLRAAIGIMKMQNVKIIEGYPATETKDGQRLSSGSAWNGPIKIYEELGFKIVQSDNPLKPLVRLMLEKEP